MGTPLMIIAMNSAAGLVSYLSGQSLDVTHTLIFVGAGLVGTFAGWHLARITKPSVLPSAFAT